MPELLAAVAVLSNCFKKYAGRDGDPKTLSKKEVKELLQAEFGAPPRVSETVCLESRVFIRAHTRVKVANISVMCRREMTTRRQTNSSRCWTRTGAAQWTSWSLPPWSSAWP